MANLLGKWRFQKNKEIANLIENPHSQENFFKNCTGQDLEYICKTSPDLLNKLKSAHYFTKSIAAHAQPPSENQVINNIVLAFSTRPGLLKMVLNKPIEYGIQSEDLSKAYFTAKPGTSFYKIIQQTHRKYTSTFTHFIVWCYEKLNVKSTLKENSTLYKAACRKDFDQETEDKKPTIAANSSQIDILTRFRNSEPKAKRRLNFDGGQSLVLTPDSARRDTLLEPIPEEDEEYVEEPTSDGMHIS